MGYIKVSLRNDQCPAILRNARPTQNLLFEEGSLMKTFTVLALRAITSVCGEQKI